MSDKVNHPDHYNTGKFECIEVMREIYGNASVLDFCLLNAFKYLYRTDRKGYNEDISKAKWYLDYYLDLTEEIIADGKDVECGL